mgnify:CR=1 FL=1
MKKILALILAGCMVLSMAACGGSETAAPTEENTATTEETKEEAPAEKAEETAEEVAAEVPAGGKVGVCIYKFDDAFMTTYRNALQAILEEKGYTVKGVDLSDLQTADIALNDGEVDVNVEQHTAYMDNFNKSYDGDLVAISPIPTVPAGVYSKKYDSIDDIPNGAKVAVPNDASNTARCYLMLQKIGWIKLDENADPSAITQDDITENPHNIKFTEMNSMTIPATMADFDYVAITGSVVYNAGIDASTALANEDIQAYLVLQVVVKKENKDAAWAQAIVDAYHSDEFKEYMKKNNDGLWWIPKELQ